MNNEQLMVKEFHDRFEVPSLPHPQLPSRQRCDLRVELIREEFQDELIPAIEAGDIVAVADLSAISPMSCTARRWSSGSIWSLYSERFIAQI